ncbi:MAG TPA: glycosyltransferase [Tepidisphaeraceae bacterium]|jgi:glycosyltransferase involved in cell wall biosynthesis|nr:glycosyltransferase [Tepidisphaeraceae bacterium]
MKLSVMMITYNHEPYLRQALDSVLMQKVDFDYEIVVGEDCSTDSTRDILAEYNQKHPEKFRLLLNENNVGGVRNFYQTLQACRGQYVALLEGDDYWTCDTKVARQVEFLEAHPDYALCFHNVVGRSDGGDRPDFNYVQADQPETMDLAELLEENVIPTCSAVFRHGLCEPLPSWVYKLKMADYPLHVLNARQGKIRYFNELMGGYRIHAGGIWSGTSSLDRQRETLRFFEFLLKTPGLRELPALKSNLARRYWRMAWEFEARGDRREARRYMLRSLRTRALTRTPKLRHKLRSLARVSVPFLQGHSNGAAAPRGAGPAVAPAAAHNPRVSILIPAYNAQRYVVAAVESMLAQTYRDFECIVVDDGSTDATPRLLAELAERDPRLRSIRVPHGGIVEALNAGLYAARGELIARMDSDDISLPNRLQQQIQFLDANPDVVALGTKIILVDPYASPLWEIEVHSEHARIEEEMLRGNGWAIFHPTVVIRRNALDKAGVYRPEYQWSEDLDLFLRLAQVGKLANLPDVLLRYRQHFASVNRTKLELQMRRVERLLVDAYRRRGLTMPPDFHFRPPAPLPPFEQVRAWGRRAIINRNFPVARRHAMAAICFAPLKYDSWSLMYHSVAER